MTSPAVAAIWAIARLHLNRELDLTQRRRIARDMYVEQDRMWQETIIGIEQQIEQEKRDRMDAMRTARMVAREER